MPIKVLKLLKTCFIIGPAILSYSNSLIAREVTFLILASEVILACNHDKRLDRLAFRIN
jgi:hypothetical protein